MDHTDIIVLLIKLAVAIVSITLIPLIKGKIDAGKFEQALQYIDIFVAAAEQLFVATDGEAKKAWVQDRLEQYGFDIDSDAVDAEIEAAVLRLHADLRGDA